MRALVTGGAGFLGSRLVKRLRDSGWEVSVPRRRDTDLVDAAAVKELFATERPEVVFHLAAEVGGIGANQTNPGRFWYANLAMGMHVLEESRRAEVDKLIMLGTVCSYPKHCAVPFKEADLWNGYPEETNAPYGVAKKALFTGASAYREQYGLNSVCLLPVNLYGPGDNFDLTTSHVIPALIRKMSDAEGRDESNVTLWGDGSPTREFLFVDDCVEALLLALERYNLSEPLNIGSGCEISIRDLAREVADTVGYQGTIEWDVTRPNGQPRRRLDTSRAGREIGFRASTPLHVGLRETASWYEAHARPRVVSG